MGRKRKEQEGRNGTESSFTFSLEGTFVPRLSLSFSVQRGGGGGGGGGDFQARRACVECHSAARTSAGIAALSGGVIDSLIEASRIQPQTRHQDRPPTPPVRPANLDPQPDQIGFPKERGTKPGLGRGGRLRLQKFKGDWKSRFRPNPFNTDILFSRPRRSTDTQTIEIDHRQRSTGGVESGSKWAVSPVVGRHRRRQGRADLLTNVAPSGTS